MIEMGLSDEYLEGFNARLKGKPFDKDQSEDWKQGWMNANQSLKW